MNPIEAQEQLVQDLLGGMNKTQREKKKEPDFVNGKPGHQAGEVTVRIVRTIIGGMTTTQLIQTDRNATVPSNTQTNQFATPQDFVDAVVAFLADAGNDVTVTADVIENTRTP